MDVTKNNMLEVNDVKQRFEVLMELGDCYTSVGNFDQAKPYYEKAATLEPDESGPYVGLGVMAIQQEQYQDAEVAFNVALRLDKKCDKAYAGLAMIAQNNGDYQTAFDRYLKCLDIDTNNMTALLGLFQTSCQIGSFGKIIYYLKLYLDMHPGDVSVMFTLASLYVKQNDLKKAEEILSKIIVLAPNNSDAAGLLEEVHRGLKVQSKGMN